MFDTDDDEPEYARPDLYYCPGCGQFFDRATDRKVKVSMEELRRYPATLRAVKKARKTAKLIRQIDPWETCH